MLLLDPKYEVRYRECGSEVKQHLLEVKATDSFEGDTDHVRQQISTDSEESWLLHHRLRLRQQR